MAADEKSGEPVKDKNELHIFKELVDELYNFRDCYFETHSMEEAGRKQSDVMQEMERTLKTLEEKGDRYKNKAEFLLQRGRCLNVAPDFSTVAEECLSRAVKLEPGLVEGWNTLGEQYWKKGDLVGAKNCFTGALQQSKNKVSLRNLSMVLRQLPAADGDTCTKQVLESLDMARQAVQLDVTDGTSWYILGNADVSMFFTGGQNPRFSQQAFGAYAQSEKVDRAASCYPELHFNRATLYQYEEMFGSALDGYSRAAALDPGWKEPPQREKQLLEYLEKVTALVQNKGKVKARRLRTMLSNLNTSALGPCSSPEFRSPTGRVGSLEPRTLSSLSHGHNAGLAALGKVVFSLASEDRMAFTFGMVDSEETCMVVMVYNTAAEVQTRRMNTLQTLFLLAAGLSGAVSQEDNVLKVLPQFRNMILCVLPKSSPILDYADYGCYCGKGGSGTPVDDLDRCCMVHDHCYDDAMHLDECRSIIDSPYIKIYHYRCYMKNKITCRKNKDACARFICECDKKAAECFARTELNPKNKRLPKDQCQ